MHPENDKYGDKTEAFSGRDILYREGSIGLLDVQRAGDALLRQGRKPSIATIREQLGGGSPNTITPLLAKYWESLGSRLGDGPESLQRVPEALARVTELFWRRALEEARARLKSFQEPETWSDRTAELQGQIGNLTIALAEARAREGEQLTQLAILSREREALRAERATLLALLTSSQALLEQRGARCAALERAQRGGLPARRQALSHIGIACDGSGQRNRNRVSPTRAAHLQRTRKRKPKKPK